jgi:ATP-dependent DNA helicase DinG
MTHLVDQEIIKLLSKDGPVSRVLPHFEIRHEQSRMLQSIIKAYNENQVALIEAGTGTGKSLAYLLPALFWALKNQEKTIISTHTINLQEQLIQKDLPVLLKALGVQLKAVIVKGMGNYLCLKKMDDASKEFGLYCDEEKQELEEVIFWSQKTTTGCRSTLPFSLNHMTWDRLACESDSCLRQRCPFFENCHFFKARKEAEDANLLISNHALLFQDLAIRKETENYEDPALLPHFSKVILDEAHTLEETATQALALKVSQQDMIRFASRLAHPKIGKCVILYERVKNFFTRLDTDIARHLINLLAIELPSYFRDLFRQIEQTFQAFLFFVSAVAPEERSFRLLPHHFDHPFFKNDVVQACQELKQTIKNIDAILFSIDSSFEDLEPKFKNETASLRKEILATSKRLVSFSLAIQSFLKAEETEGKVRWIEIRRSSQKENVWLISADMEISEILKETLFSKFSTTVLLSATLTSNGSFNFVKKRLGLNEAGKGDKIVTESLFQSPFDYLSQALFVIPNDLPPPDDPHFLQQAGQTIVEAVQASQGGAFVLFTSYQQMNLCYKNLNEIFKAKGFTLLKQGDESRQILLNKFKNTKRCILFATSSFWQGVDVAGDALRLVIIVKIPFQVPSEPLIEARLEEIHKKGGSPFYEYSIPNAIVRFKQGFGRLIRNKQDRGCIICLDNRLLSKPYGKIFLKSLPECLTVFDTKEKAIEAMRAFYKKRSYAVK